MKNTLKKAAVAALATAGIAAGTIAGTAPAQAATPANLQLYGWVNCYWKGWGPTWDNLPGWRMHRVLGVRNTSDTFTMTGVSITELNGSSKLVKVGKQAPGELRKGQYYRLVDTTWNGCWPSSVAGYTIGHQAENVFDNAGFWANVRQQQGNQQQTDNKSGANTVNPNP